MGEKSKVYIVCCNRLLRESIARILSKKADFNILAAQAPSSTSREEIIESGADALVLDSLEFLLESPAAGGISALGRALRCVLVAMEDDHSRFLRAVRCGARGYVLQDASAVDVVSAIRMVVDGEAVCPLRYARVLFDYVARQALDQPTDRRSTQWGLTRRERQLVPLIGQGLSNKEIASQLSLSEQTVKNHIHRMLQKVGVPDRLSVFEACRAELLNANTKDGGYVV